MASLHEDWLACVTFQAGVVGHDQQDRGPVAGGGGQVCQRLIIFGQRPVFRVKGGNRNLCVFNTSVLETLNVTMFLQE